MKPICLECIKELSSQARFKIFNYLLQNRKRVNVSDLIDVVKLQQPTVTFHVNALVRVGIVKKYKKGRQVFCETYKKCANCPLFSKTFNRNSVFSLFFGLSSFYYILDWLGDAAVS